MTTTHSRTWLITGASSGFGKSLAREALDAGYRVIGTTRNISRAEASFPDFASRGGIWVALDPAQKDAFDRFAECARDHDVDVLVNSAGFAFIGGVEDTSEDEVRGQLEVNFYGPMRAVRACLPVMRAKGSGHIILISSGAGFIARPGRGTYAASKFAVEAMHESLAQEVSTLGVKVLIVEPGSFRTPFSRHIATPARYADRANGCSDAYRGTVVEQMVALTRDMMDVPDYVKGDPDKAARAILRAVVDGHEFLRMPLGDDCVEALESKIGQLRSDLEANRAVATAMNVD